ncbi:hypothetical protein DV515_00009089 [Chloebia gouldiae]|uniref:Uncharacterized protein n=1 Tax=Chloebia gouldiae TaxID=44316 RepID=A0A3L8SDK4_CHLGU|nr:hypothetical protein DV515_00009089 [Chloebia gouldiae]
MSRQHHISCEQEEFLAAPCVGLEWQNGWSSISACFKGLGKISKLFLTSPTNYETIQTGYSLPNGV